MKRVYLTICLLAVAFIASAQYAPGKNIYGNLNVHESLWVNENVSGVDTISASAGYITTIYNTSMYGNEVKSQNVTVYDTLFNNKLTVVNYSDTLAYGDSILVCTGLASPDFWVAVDTLGKVTGKADIIVSSSGTVTQLYAPYGGVAVGTSTANKICVLKWGTSVYIKNNRWKHQRVTYQISYL
jgi:hypothetical protein